MKYRYQPTAEGPVKAYENKDFIHSPEARTVRVLCEFLEPEPVSRLLTSKTRWSSSVPLGSFLRSKPRSC